jgi:hypothetical protein
MFEAVTLVGNVSILVWFCTSAAPETAAAAKAIIMARPKNS